jgi:spore cortex biosynthesis protein YabQ
MLFATVGQGSVFLWMLLCGMLVGAVYDCFRLLRCLLRAGAALTLALDAAWGVCSGVLLALMLVIANRGDMRPYVLLAVLLGFGLYAAAASRPAAWLARRGMGCVQKVSRFRLLRAVFK